MDELYTMLVTYQLNKMFTLTIYWNNVVMEKLIGGYYDVMEEIELIKETSKTELPIEALIEYPNGVKYLQVLNS